MDLIANARTPSWLGILSFIDLYIEMNGFSSFYSVLAAALPKKEMTTSATAQSRRRSLRSQYLLELRAQRRVNA
jgi:hypothetical protein